MLRRGRFVCPRRNFLEVRFARLGFGRSRNAIADLFSMGAASCSAGVRYVRGGRRGTAHHLQTPRKPATLAGRRGAKVFFLQEQGCGMTQIAILGAGSWGTALSVVL